jgi:hypothetical protein
MLSPPGDKKRARTGEKPVRRPLLYPNPLIYKLLRELARRLLYTLSRAVLKSPAFATSSTE